jgi:hypothetical protein
MIQAVTPSMREHPALFSGVMVRALMREVNPKTVTRRLDPRWMKVKAGDRIWVRETSAIVSIDGRHVNVARAERMPAGKTLSQTDGGLESFEIEDPERLAWFAKRVDSERWKPSIFMPREISRILLECEEDARLERLQDITEEEAKAEGVDPWWEADLQCDGELRDGPSRAYYAGFMDIWQALHTKPGERWEDNPEVIRVGRFRRIQVSAA